MNLDKIGNFIVNISYFICVNIQINVRVSSLYLFYHADKIKLLC